MLSDERRDFRGSFSGYERDRFFYNPDGERGALVPSAYVLGLDDDHDGRAAAPVDIDGDGDLDLALLTLTGLRLLENTTMDGPTERSHFARVRVTSADSAGPAVGAALTVVADGVTHRDYVRVTEGFQTQVPGDVHVGLGPAERIDRLEVRWPSGRRDVWADLPVDRRLHVSEGASEVVVEVLERWADGTRPTAAGAPTTAIEAPQLDGKVAQLVGGQRPSVINFWAPWCAPCNIELPQLVSLAGTFAEEVDFVGVSVESDDLESVEDAIDKFGIPYAQFLANQSVMEQFFGDDDEAALPSTFVFDQNDRLRRVFRGPITEADLDALLRSFRDEGVFQADLELAARTAVRLGDHQKAMEHYGRLAEVDQTSAQPLYQVGVSALELGDLEEARRAFELAVNRAPNNAMAQLGLGVALMRSGQAGDAFGRLRRALRLAEGNSEMLRSVATAAVSAGQLWLAADALAMAVELDPTSVSAWVDLGQLREARGEQTLAHDAFTQALALDSDDEAARAGFDRTGAGSP